MNTDPIVDAIQQLRKTIFWGLIGIQIQLVLIVSFCSGGK